MADSIAIYRHTLVPFSLSSFQLFPSCVLTVVACETMAEGWHGRRVGPDAVRQRVEAVVKALGLHMTDARGGLRPLRVVGLGAGAWGAVFMCMLQEMYGNSKDLVDITIWRRGGRVVSKSAVTSMLDVANADEATLRRLRNSSVYLKYVSARLGDRTLTADEMLRDGFCLNLPDCPLCPIKVSRACNSGKKAQEAHKH